MRIPLTPSPAFLAQLADPSSTPSPSDPPLIWIDSQPFLLELQGILEPPADEKGAGEAGDAAGASMEGVRVGKVDLADPKKPVLRIAHHRLEGKVEKLLTPYALLRTTRSSSSAPTRDDDDDTDPRSTKRRKLCPTLSSPSQPLSSSSSSDQPQISLAALITHKLVFSRRPEPLIDVSSEADPGFGERKREALESWGKRGAGGAGAKRGGGGGLGGFFGKSATGTKGKEKEKAGTSAPETGKDAGAGSA
ncbi:RHTO0S11e00738g1_1 [Rhodotorula toruloides]|uniref:RHTO0S11e00738g1_1 n=1 Tax=Rhodotorula toruloides TaxID=5286 RepID=A0A061BEW7_RHOTO|nr:RHTO0S11e00738g1_1 [Rhodotorula toruloides]